MKWLSELQSSFRLDARPKRQTCAGERPNQDCVQRVHTKLVLAEPTDTPPPSLHQSIMAAVRRQETRDAAEAGTNVQRFVFWSRFAAASGVAAILVLVGILLLEHRPGPKSPSADLPQQIMALPAKAVSPLSAELDSVQQDLERTTSFILASVPEIEN